MTNPDRPLRAATLFRRASCTPAAKRKLGYCALPLLWRSQVMGWGNLARRDRQLDAQLGYVAGRAPREAVFRTALGAELSRFDAFLGA